jgi:glycosyltransferase involved in cell wall biosynthesis
VEFVRYGENGLVVAPDPKALAHAFAELMENQGLAERLGARGRQDAAAMTWSDVVKKLVIVGL